VNFTPAKLPGSVITVEGLTVWALLALQPSLSKLQVAESVGAISGPRIDSNIFTNADGELNLVFRVSLRLTGTALIDDGYLFEKVEVLTNDPIPPQISA